MNQTAMEVVKPEPVTPMRLLEIAANQNADIDKLHKLMELQMTWEANEARKAFTVAMMTFKKNPPQINKNQHVKIQPKDGGRAYEYDHATLDHACDMIIPALAAVGISHGWKVNQSEQISVTCVLTHEFGHKDETTLRAGPDTSGGKNSIQAISSTVTYLQRYSLLSAVGMAPKGLDKDGKLPLEEGSNKLAEHLVVAALDDIDACDSLVELQRIFGSRYKMGIEAGDKDFVAQLIKAKDARKEAIRAAS